MKTRGSVASLQANVARCRTARLSQTDSLSIWLPLYTWVTLQPGPRQQDTDRVWRKVTVQQQTLLQEKEWSALWWCSQIGFFWRVKKTICDYKKTLKWAVISSYGVADNQYPDYQYIHNTYWQGQALDLQSLLSFSITLTEEILLVSCSCWKFVENSLKKEVFGKVRWIFAFKTWWCHTKKRVMSLRSHCPCLCIVVLDLASVLALFSSWQTFLTG